LNLFFNTLSANFLTLIPTSDRLTPCETGLIEKSGLRKHGDFDILIGLDAC